MNQNDISAILPAGDSPEQHYIQNSEIVSPIFVQEGNADMATISSQFPNIFYCRRSMKSLLEQRSQVCTHLHLNLKPSKKSQPEIPLQSMYQLVSQLFSQSPTPFDPLHFVFIFDCGTAYGFFSGDGKFVPMCKKCNFSVYVVIRKNIVKLICCNTKCRVKILGENAIDSGQQGKKQFKEKQSKLSTRRTPTQKTESARSQGQQQRELTKEELNMIKKTAKKITYS